MIDRYGEEYAGDAPFVKMCRRLQSIYRVEIGEEIKPYKGRDGMTHYYGNYINGENGRNFLTPYAFEYALFRSAKQNKKKHETIERERLLNNLLSSQSMAFNLFCPLRKMLMETPEAATRVIKYALPPDYPIHTVTEVDLEFIPENYKKLSGDKSAMDAIIRFTNKDGQKGFIAIETKYSENLGTNVAYEKGQDGTKRPRTQNLVAVRKIQCFKPDVEKRILCVDADDHIPLTQIHRNFLLSEMYGLEGEEEKQDSYSIVLAPKGHPSTKREVESLSNSLRDDYKFKIRKVTLEDFVNKLIEHSPEEYRTVFKKFYDRYLDFKKVDNTKP